MKADKEEVSKNKEIPELYIRDIAGFAGCCQQTVKNYEKRGFLHPVRDKQGFRRYTKAQAIAMKAIFSLRYPNDSRTEK